MTPTVRLTRREDVPVILAIYESGAREQEKLKPGWEFQASWGESTGEVIADAVSSAAIDGLPAAVFVGEVDGQVVAYVLASLEAFPGGRYQGRRHRLRIHHLLVDEPARGIGVGELLLLAAAEWGRANGAGICEMEVLPGHRAAKNFCEAHGLKARSLTMSGSIDQTIASIEVDPEERRALSEAVQGALLQQPTSAGQKIDIAAGCIVVANERLLLARREDPPYQGWWSIPGGRPLSGETLAECARREVLEETGIAVKILGIAGLAERFWESEKDLSSGWVIVNFIGTPETAGDFSEPGRMADGENLVWASVDSLPVPLVPGIAAFLDRSRDAIDAVAASRPLPPAIYSPPEDSR